MVPVKKIRSYYDSSEENSSEPDEPREPSESCNTSYQNFAFDEDDANLYMLYMEAKVTDARFKDWL